MLSSETEQYKQKPSLLPHADFSVKLSNFGQWSGTRYLAWSQARNIEVIFSPFFSHSPYPSFSLHPSTNMQAFFFLVNSIAFSILHSSWFALSSTVRNTKRDRRFRTQEALSLNTKLTLKINWIITNSFSLHFCLKRLRVDLPVLCQITTLPACQLPVTQQKRFVCGCIYVYAQEYEFAHSLTRVFEPIL